MRTVRSVAFATILLLAGGARAEPGKAQAAPGEPVGGAGLDEAKDVVATVLEVVRAARPALDLFGLIPRFECGEQRRTAAQKLAHKLRAQWPCAQVEPRPGEAEDRVVVSVPAGCAVRGVKLGGRAEFVLSGGKERLGVVGDLTAFEVGGKPLRSKLSYETCGDGRSVGLVTEGDLKKDAGYRVDLKLGVRPGMPIVGSSTLLLDGTTTVRAGDKRDVATFTAVEYKPGELLPKTGSIAVQTRGGRTVQTTFQKKLWRLGQATVVVDGGRPVTVPVVR